MIAISQKMHAAMLAATTTLPATYCGNGTVSVRSNSVNINYLVRFMATERNSLVSCPCKSFRYYTPKTGQPCLHVVAAYQCLAKEAAKPQRAA